MRLIGMTGRKRSGKDTVGAYLRMEHGFAQESFAKPLKEAVRYIYGWGHEHLDGSLKEVVDPYWQTTPRAVLQFLGTEIGRQLDANIWVKSLQRRLESIQTGSGGPTSFVITDVRFPNEAAAIKSWGGFVVDVVRPQAPEALADGRDSDHPSETALDLYADWDGVIINDGTIEQLRDQVTKLVDRFLHVLAMREREEVS
jgi:hypothetical protein